MYARTSRKITLPTLVCPEHCRALCPVRLGVTPSIRPYARCQLCARRGGNLNPNTPKICKDLRSSSNTRWAVSTVNQCNQSTVMMPQPSPPSRLQSADSQNDCCSRFVSSIEYSLVNQRAALAAPIRSDFCTFDQEFGTILETGHLQPEFDLDGLTWLGWTGIGIPFLM